MSQNTENKSANAIKNSVKTQDKVSPNHPVKDSKKETLSKEFGGRKDGLDPTRYGDWEKNGRCIDF